VDIDLWLVQWLCPNRHALAASPYDKHRTTPEAHEAALLAEAARNGLEARCALCGSRELHFEHGKLPFGDWASAMAALLETERLNIETRRAIDERKQSSSWMKTDEYVIWSIEHQAWWPASRMGYVLTLALAGRFSREDAAAIVEHANYPPGTFHECMIPLEAFGEYFQVPRTRITPAMIRAVRRDVALGASHECSDWIEHGVCLICDQTI